MKSANRHRHCDSPAPTHTTGKDLRLYQQNVRDLPALRRWLETLLDDHHRSSKVG